MSLVNGSLLRRLETGQARSPMDSRAWTELLTLRTGGNQLNHIAQVKKSPSISSIICCRVLPWLMSAGFGIGQGEGGLSSEHGFAPEILIVAVDEDLIDARAIEGQGQEQGFIHQEMPVLRHEGIVVVEI